MFEREREKKMNLWQKHDKNHNKRWDGEKEVAAASCNTELSYDLALEKYALWTE